MANVQTSLKAVDVAAIDAACDCLHGTGPEAFGLKARFQHSIGFVAIYDGGFKLATLLGDGELVSVRAGTDTGLLVKAVEAMAEACRQ